jgi:DNA-directed RNA polymerase subunit RPC12/RpoP
MLDFSFLRTFMKKGGLVMQVLKCPECSASIKFPKNGTQTKCAYCGRTIHAQDIFEKVKKLLE